jgi:hypothetical protein
MSMLDTSDVKQALDRKQQRHYVGVCVDNADPLQLGRLKVKVPELYGEIPDAHLPWCNPSIPFGGGSGYGFFFIPIPGSKVRIILWRNHPWFPVWQGVHWFEGETPDEAKLTPPTNYVLKTPKQHLMDFNDTKAYMRFKDFRGNYIILDTTEDTIKMFSSGEIKVLAENVYHETVGRDKRVSVGGDFNLDVEGTIHIRAGGGVNIDGNPIHLNSGLANPSVPDEPEDVEIQ